MMKKHTASPSDRLYKILNVSVLEDAGKVIEESADAIIALIKADPKVCSEKYPIDIISLEFIYPFHALCALCNGTNPTTVVSLLKKMYKAYPDAILDNTTQIGNPVHYICTYNPTCSVEIIHYIVVKHPTVLEEVTIQQLRTPLHVACYYECSIDIIAYLTEKYPLACSIQDEDGYTPLHYACDIEHGGSKLDVIADLTEVCPEACIKQLDDLSTPLHLALKNHASIDIIKDLVRSNKDSLSIPDDKGNLPIHTAVQSITTIDSKKDIATSSSIFEIIKLLTVKYSDALEISNHNSETPTQLAQRLGLDDEIVEYLNPYEEE